MNNCFSELSNYNIISFFLIIIIIIIIIKYLNFNQFLLILFSFPFIILISFPSVIKSFFYIFYTVYINKKVLNITTNYFRSFKPEIIETKSSLPLLILKLIKIINFIIAFNLWAPYQHHSFFSLIISGIFISFYKIIHLFLFICLKYPTEENLNNYLTLILNNLTINYKDFRLQLVGGIWYFDGFTFQKVSKSISRLFNKNVSLHMTDSPSNVLYIKEVEKTIHELTEIFFKDPIANSNFFYSNGFFKNKNICASGIFYTTKINKNTNYAYSIITQINLFENIKSYQSIHLIENSDSKYARDGLIITKFSDNLIYVSNHEIILELECEIYAYFCVLNSNIEEIKKTGLFDMKKLNELKLKIKHLEEISNNLNIFKINDTQNNKFFLLKHWTSDWNLRRREKIRININ